MVAMPVLAAGTAARRKDVSPGIAGQGMGLIHSIRPAAAVFRELTEQASRLLGDANRYTTA